MKDNKEIFEYRSKTKAKSQTQAPGSDMVAWRKRLGLPWFANPCTLGLETFGLGAFFVLSKK